MRVHIHVSWWSAAEARSGGCLKAKRQQSPMTLGKFRAVDGRTRPARCYRFMDVHKASCGLVKSGHGRNVELCDGCDTVKSSDARI